MASFVIAFPVRGFDEEFYLLSNGIINLFLFKLLMRLERIVCFGGAWGVQMPGYCHYGVLVERGAKFLRSDHSAGISALSLRLR